MGNYRLADEEMLDNITGQDFGDLGAKKKKPKGITRLVRSKAFKKVLVGAAIVGGGYLVGAQVIAPLLKNAAAAKAAKSAAGIAVDIATTTQEAEQAALQQQAADEALRNANAEMNTKLKMANLSPGQEAEAINAAEQETGIKISKKGGMGNMTPIILGGVGLLAVVMIMMGRRK